MDMNLNDAGLYNLTAAISGFAAYSLLGISLSPGRGLPNWGGGIWYSAKLLSFLILALGFKLNGNEYWAHILSEAAFGVALGPAFATYVRKPENSRLANWYHDRLSGVADGVFAGSIAVFFAAVLGYLVPVSANIVMCVLAGVFVLGRAGKLLGSGDVKSSPMVRHQLLVSIRRRLPIFGVAFTMMSWCLVTLMPFFSFDSGSAEWALAFFAGVVLSFL
ncbi:hypothetical protein [Agrobacterium tumefaciens]|uniref:hypothetical protein n=1 Tax=Agrobacterium tumefaciens TaxID=358 RepID=UPI00129B166F|nr:hypothetical protein [Agrobacterium tumefaciens]MRH98238.1 hypothetical protein [Agrobacterium tumefaciens]